MKTTGRATAEHRAFQRLPPYISRVRPSLGVSSLDLGRLNRGPFSLLQTVPTKLEARGRPADRGEPRCSPLSTTIGCYQAGGSARHRLFASMDRQWPTTPPC